MTGLGRAGLGLRQNAMAAGGAADALLDADFTAGNYRHAGRRFADDGQFRLAIGATVPAAGHLIIGPYVSSGSRELLSDGNFSAGTTADWTGVGSSLALISGALRVTGGGGSGSGAYRSIAGLVASAGRAYRLTANVWRETASNAALGFGSGGAGTANYAQTANLTNTSPAQATLYCGGFSPTNASIALRHQVNPSTGTYWVDDLSLREAVPYAGFTPGALCGIVEAMTPASGGTGAVVFQADDNAEFNGNWFERNFIRLIWDASQHLHFIVSFGGSGTQVEQVNLDLGVVAPGTRFTVGFSAREGAYLAGLLGQSMMRASAGTFPGLAAIRLGRGRSIASGLWTGSIARLRLFSGLLDEENLVAQMAGNGVVAWAIASPLGPAQPAAVRAISPIRWWRSRCSRRRGLSCGTGLAGRHRRRSRRA